MLPFLPNFLDILNEYGSFTYETASREEVHRLGLIYRAVHLYLINEEGYLLLQRRSALVDHFPGQLSISLTGHVDAGESSSQALYREIKEELHLDPASLKIDFLFSYRQDYIVRSDYIDRQFNDVYLCRHPFVGKDMYFDVGEIKGLEIISLQAFKNLMKDKDSLLSQIYGKEWEALLYLNLV